ncbi:hypothetical protein CDAR_547741 [Caerostris darwini]|uniref:Uncharacterized protein n=1 Tax=Caerostris darwini TaxID=1538125 RepID=A0AAV4WEQ1_9ARAC|nr:hypothetical protein CDAR_547741 [Caerostris darwini]
MTPDTVMDLVMRPFEEWTSYGDLKQTNFHCEPAERLSGGSEVVGLKFSLLKPLEAEKSNNLNEASRKWLALLDYTSILEYLPQDRGCNILKRNEIKTYTLKN